MAKTTPSGRAKSKTKAPKKKPTQLDRIERSIGLIESKLTTLNAWETLNEAMSNDKLASPTVSVEEEPQGLKDGDYTDTSKDVADKLTAMGFTWSDKDRTRCNIIGYYATPPHVLNCHLGVIEDAHYPPAEFLARAAVTAKALGLKPVEEKWVPKVGDMVEHVDNTWTKAYKVKEATIETTILYNSYGGAHRYNTKDLCLATPEKVAAHEAKVKAEAQAAEDAKLVFGAPIQHEHKGRGIWMSKNERNGLHELAFLNIGERCQHNWHTMHCERNDFTLLP